MSELYIWYSKGVKIYVTDYVTYIRRIMYDRAVYGTPRASIYM